MMVQFGWMIKVSVTLSFAFDRVTISQSLKYRYRLNMDREQKLISYQVK